MATTAREMVVRIDAVGFRARIREIASERGLSLSEVGRRAGVTKSTLWRAMSTDRPGEISMDTMRKIADALDEPVGRVFYLSFAESMAEPVTESDRRV